MKLLRVLIIFLAITLFAGCEVWISFWGDANQARSIQVEVSYPYNLSDLGGELTVALYKRIGSSYQEIRTEDAGSSSSLTYTFEDLDYGTYKVSVWDDEDLDTFPNDTDEEGFTTDPIDLALFSQYTVSADSSSEWQQDGAYLVTPVN